MAKKLEVLLNYNLIEKLREWFPDRVPKNKDFSDRDIARIQGQQEVINRIEIELERSVG